MNTQALTQLMAQNLYQSELTNLNALIDSNSLFKNGDVVFILHKGEQYTLRRTRNGKLILNK
ncbi:hemin uptake protein HemP [Nitrosomonas ureae]|jgi:hemin uptake protein HemP|uniref:Hemin uptake protein hemP n=2 Tax=Nitrosomonas ureae TaxID=44577 RepID=A0A0S3AFL9_9PROT|nr:hemin transporter [Nitrosomonas ureae]SDU29320.1 Hemin uptake protein hemP [Nitrosomonas ureae]SNX61113.1 Hemin uptake protein hemP [Nitrosomonas ureae]SOD16709.1 Hemin uptake protein hemP [Nitrosomonas ureae]